ncbi:hypothetical protein ACWECC_15200 [Streptomyces microflavus]
MTSQPAVLCSVSGTGGIQCTAFSGKGVWIGTSAPAASPPGTASLRVIDSRATWRDAGWTVRALGRS